MFRIRHLLPLILSLSTLPPLSVSAADEALTLGVFPRRTPAVTQVMFQPLADYLEAQLGRKVLLEVPADYPSFWDGVEQGRYDLLHYNQYHYVKARQAFGHRLLVANREAGRADIRAIIAVRRDSKYRNLRDLIGGKIIFGGGPDAMVSRILAIDTLEAAGIRAGDYLEQFAQNPVKAVIALGASQGDAAAAGEPALGLPSVTRALDPASLRILAHSQRIPHLPWALADSTIEAGQIQKILLGLNQSPAGNRILDGMQIDAFNKVEDHDYDVVRAVIRRVKGEAY